MTAQRQGSGGTPTERRGASTVVHRVCQPSPLSSERISYNFEGTCHLTLFSVHIQASQLTVLARYLVSVHENQTSGVLVICWASSCACTCILSHIMSSVLRVHAVPIDFTQH